MRFQAHSPAIAGNAVMIVIPKQFRKYSWNVEFEPVGKNALCNGADCVNECE